MDRKDARRHRKSRKDQARREDEAWDLEPPILAFDSKHLPQLRYPLPLLKRHVTLIQDSTNGSTTGTTLWPSAQILACYIQASAISYFSKVPQDRRKGEEPPPVAVELGAGVGLTSMLLALLGWKIFATDIEPSLSTVLKPTIEANSDALSSADGSCTALHLDWLAVDDTARTLFGDSIDLIVTTDTIYASDLVDPLFRAIKALATPGHTRILLALERRDPAMVDGALQRAREVHGVSFKPIDPEVIVKAAAAHGNKAWTSEDIEDVQVLELTL